MIDLQTVLQDIAISMILINMDRKIVYVNSALTDLLGYEADECMGAHIDKLVTEASRVHTAQSHRSIQQRSMVRRIAEREYLHKDGTPIPVLSSAIVYANSDNEPQVVALQLMDMSVQKQAERELVINEKRYKYAIQSAKHAVWDRDERTGEVYFSDLWYEMRGLEPGDRNVNSDWLSRIHPEDRDDVSQESREWKKGIFQEGGIDYRERHADGHWMWVQSRGSVMQWDEDGKPNRIIGTDVDITPLRETALVLEAMSSRLELALATSKVGVWEVNLTTGEVHWDDMIKEIYGRPDIDGTDVPDDLWEACLHPEDAEFSIKKIREIIDTRTQAEWSYRIIWPDGSIRHVEANARVHGDGAGELVIIGTNRDVTRDVIAATKLKQAVEDLKRSSEDLRHAKNIAEEKNNQLEVAHSRMEHNSLHDALTGLPNRRYLDETLAKFSNNGACLLHIDLDRFKQINDTLGHAAGDAMLIHAANILRSNVAGGDFVARVGGDEFVVFIDTAKSNSDLASMAKRIILKMSEPVDYQGHECRFGVSVGITGVEGGNIDTKQMLINGDIALYLAKENGRNRYEFFTKEMQSEIVHTKKRADEILTGLEQAQFVAYYQPQFDARTFEIVGVEALVRWHHPRLGTLAPFEFLKIAADLNVVAQIDGLILEQSMADMENWRNLGVHVPKVSVNVSARRLHDEHLIEILSQLKIPKGTLSFELLESIFLDEDDDIINYNIDHIKELGIGIDIDDFGTGHASIIGLLKLNPDQLKIDQQLIRPITKSRQQRDLVKSIIDIGRSLGIQIVAEGVETMEHVRILQLLGCDTLQGYVFARPMCAADLVRFVPGREWMQMLRAS